VKRLAFSQRTVRLISVGVDGKKKDQSSMWCRADKEIPTEERNPGNDQIRERGGGFKEREGAIKGSRYEPKY